MSRFCSGHFLSPQGFRDNIEVCCVVIYMLNFLEIVTFIQLHLAPVASKTGGSICTSLSGVCVPSLHAFQNRRLQNHLFLIHFVSRSYHNGHVCICFPLPLAFLCCCCNLCPTADRGFNKCRVEVTAMSIVVLCGFSRVSQI